MNINNLSLIIKLDCERESLIREMNLTQSLLMILIKCLRFFIS